MAPTPRQLSGEDPLGSAAVSTGSRTLRPRLEEADKVGTIICPYCAVGCAQLIYAKGNQVIHIEGDPRSPINQGTLCPKGAATFGWMVNPNRFTKVKYRAPYSDHWEERPLDWAMERIAQLVKRTRDEIFVPELPNGPTVNHTMAVASLEDFKDASQVDGLFSGWEEDRRAYVYSTWQYEGHVIPASLSEHYVNTGESYA